MTRRDLRLLEVTLVDVMRKVEAALTKVKDELYNTSPRETREPVNRGTPYLESVLTQKQLDLVAFGLDWEERDL